MTLDQIIEHCRKQQELQISADPPVVFKLPGTWGKTNRKRLFRKVPHGMLNPLGRIIADYPGRRWVLVEFNAQSVLDACHALKALALESDD